MSESAPVDAATAAKPESMPLVETAAGPEPTPLQESGKAAPEKSLADSTTEAARDSKVPSTPPSLLENQKVILAFTCVDLTASCLFTYACIMFIPSKMVVPANMVLGLNLFVLGCAMYVVMISVFTRETLKMVGMKSMEFAEQAISIVAFVLFLLGLVLFYPAHTLPRWIGSIRRPLIALSNAIAPEYVTHLPGSEAKDPGPQGFPLTAAMVFLVGSLLFCVPPMLHMINMSNENLKDQIRDVINQIIRGIAGVLFTAGSVFFIPGIGCNTDAAALGAYMFIGASLCFAFTAVSDMIASIMAVADSQRGFSAVPSLPK